MKLASLGKKKSGSEQVSSRPNVRWRPGVAFYGVCLFLAAVAVILALNLSARYSAERALASQQQEQGAQSAQVLAHAVARSIAGQRQRLAALAQWPDVLARAGGEDVVELERATELLGAQRVLLLPAGFRQLDTRRDPPLGYAVIDLVRQAEETGEAPAAEVHLPGGPGAHINLLQPIERGGEVIGHLLVTYPIDYLTGLLAGAPGGVVLEQMAAGGGARILRLKGGSEGGAVARVDGTPWRLRYAPPTAHLGFDGWLGLFAGLLVLLLMGAGILLLLRRTIVADGQTMLRIVQDLKQEQLGLEYPAKLADLRPCVAAAVKAAWEEQKAGSQLKGGAVAAPQDRNMGRKEGAVYTENQSNTAPGPQGLDVTEEELPPEAEAEQPAQRESSGQALQLDASILRAYDIRGLVGPSLNAQVVRALGQAIGSEAAANGQKEIVVARDGRLSSDELATALIEGLQASGRSVIDVGRVPTPVMNFATFQLGTGAGVMVTGSHNPGDHNGLKIVIDGHTLSGAAIQALGKRVEAGDYISGEGDYRQLDVLSEYMDRITQDATLHRPLKVVVDCGNGVAAEVAPQLFRAMGCEVEELFCEVDGYFPNHHPDPTVPENLSALISLVRLQEADLGLAFDGDADRLGVVDAQGKIIWADRQLMLYATDVLAHHPGADIIFDVKCSADLARVITEHGGVPVMWKSGHSLIKNKLKETGSPLAGEMSGHIFFNDRWYGFDDALYCAARLLELLSADPRSSTEVFAELPDSFCTPELRIELAEGEAEWVMEQLLKRVNLDFKDAALTTIDGIRADFADGWGLVRASNTTPSLVLRFEAADEAAMARIQAQFRQSLSAIKADLVLPF